MPPKTTLDPHHSAQRRERKDALIEDLQNITDNYSTATDEATFPILQEALDVGMDVMQGFRWRSHENVHCLHVFADLGFYECVKELLLRGADPSALSPHGWDALQIAVNPRPSKTDDSVVRIVRLLFMNSKTDVNSRQSKNLKTLLTACSLGYVKTLRELLRRKPDLSKSRMGLGTALQIAVRSGNIEIVKMLIEAGADVSFASPSLDTPPLHIAVENNDVEMAELLLDAGADIEGKNDSKETPFLVAARCGSVECMSLLLERGCNVEARDSGYHTAVWLAAVAKHMKILDLLNRKKKFRDSWKSCTITNAMLFDTVIRNKDLESFKNVSFHVDVDNIYATLTSMMRHKSHEILSYYLLETNMLNEKDIPILEKLLTEENPDEQTRTLIRFKIDRLKGLPEVKKEEVESDDSDDEEDDAKQNQKSKDRKPASKKATTKKAAPKKTAGKKK